MVVLSRSNLRPGLVRVGSVQRSTNTPAALHRHVGAPESDLSDETSASPARPAVKCMQLWTERQLSLGHFPSPNGDYLEYALRKSQIYSFRSSSDSVLSPFPFS